jgi:hypothetical protein
MKSKNPVKIGDVFGRLTVIQKTTIRQKSPKCKSGYANFSASKCLCECGNYKTLVDYSLKNHATNSCGCLHKEKTSEARKTHGFSGKKNSFYTCWIKMINRCTKIHDKSYKDYGGRGIVVCEKWQKFEGFHEDMYSTWQKGLSIERIDTNGHYCKENCKWANDLEQSRNRRITNQWFYNGKWYKNFELQDLLKIPQHQVYRLKLPKRKLYSEDNGSRL